MRFTLKEFNSEIDQIKNNLYKKIGEYEMYDKELRESIIKKDKTESKIRIGDNSPKAKNKLFSRKFNCHVQYGKYSLEKIGKIIHLISEKNSIITNTKKKINRKLFKSKNFLFSLS